jgi:hypothetical protein
MNQKSWILLEEVELIGDFFTGEFSSAMEADDAFVLFVSELKNIHLPAFGQCLLHLFAVRLNLCRAGAKSADRH